MKWHFSTSLDLASLARLRKKKKKEKSLFWEFLYPLVQSSKVLFYWNQVLFHSLLHLNTETKQRQVGLGWEGEKLKIQLGILSLNTRVNLWEQCAVVLQCIVDHLLCGVQMGQQLPKLHGWEKKHTHTLLRYTKASPFTKKPEKSLTTSFKTDQMFEIELCWRLILDHKHHHWYVGFANFI